MRIPNAPKLIRRSLCEKISIIKRWPSSCAAEDKKHISAIFESDKRSMSDATRKNEKPIFSFVPPKSTVIFIQNRERIKARSVFMHLKMQMRTR